MNKTRLASLANYIWMMHVPPLIFAYYLLQGEITVEGSFDGGLSYRNKEQAEGVEFGSLGGFSAAFAPQMEEFVGQIVKGRPYSQHHLHKALREVMVAHATYKSVKTKEWESVALENLT